MPIVGIVTIGATPSHQRVGDLAAGSIVVDARRTRTSTDSDGTRDEHSDTHNAGLRPVAPGEQLPSHPPTALNDAPPRPPGPLWDPTRQAYVLWDEANRCWLRFDDGAQQWFRIDGL